MANITRLEPFRMDQFDDAIDHLLKGFMVRPFSLDRERQAPQIKLDVKEDSNAYTIHAEIPGVKKEDIQVAIDGNQISLGAEIKNAKEEKDGASVIRSERFYGKVSRTFSLAQEVNEDAARAKYTDGVLELTLPKKTVVEAKRLTVE